MLWARPVVYDARDVYGMLKYAFSRPLELRIGVAFGREKLRSALGEIHGSSTASPTVTPRGSGTCSPLPTTSVTSIGSVRPR